LKTKGFQGPKLVREAGLELVIYPLLGILQQHFHAISPKYLYFINFPDNHEKGSKGKK